MDEVLIPYAKLIDGGRLVTIDEVESGLACNCICDGCGAPMVARKGQQKAHHFGHAPKSAKEEKPCTFNFKRGCFWLIRQILVESAGSEIALPDYELPLTNNLARYEKRYLITKASTPVYKQLVSFELAENNETAVAVLAIGEHQLRLIFGFPKSLKAPIKTGSGCAEVFVSLANVYDCYAKAKQPFVQILKDHVFSAQFKEWRFHPRQQKCELEFNAVCVEIINKTRQQAQVQFRSPQKSVKPRPTLPAQPYAVEKTKAVPISAEAKEVIGLNSRLDEMVNTADVLYSVLQQSQAKHCEKCQFLYMVTLTSCPTCGEYMSTTIQLDALYMENLAQKYKAVGYVELSLKNFPGTSSSVVTQQA